MTQVCHIYYPKITKNSLVFGNKYDLLKSSLMIFLDTIGFVLLKSL